MSTAPDLAFIKPSLDKLQTIEQLRKDLAGKGIIVSDRRWGQTLGLLQAHALTEGRDAVTAAGTYRSDCSSVIKPSRRSRWEK